ncbi:hypothetical protein C4573_01900 [Candidatus Woesearchaeota archaeon]|nr:MAG: hypothetical protein C4573_01900 [Candidatus Woesearchaeota archaeon]
MNEAETTHAILRVIENIFEELDKVQEYMREHKGSYISTFPQHISDRANRISGSIKYLAQHEQTDFAEARIAAVNAEISKKVLAIVNELVTEEVKKQKINEALLAEIQWLAGNKGLLNFPDWAYDDLRKRLTTIQTELHNVESIEQEVLKKSRIIEKLTKALEQQD